MLDKLWKGLKDGRGVKEEFHHLALSLLKESEAVDLANKYRFPLLRFLCLVHLRLDGGWMPPHHVMPTFAKLQWTFRAVCCMEICMDGIPKEQSDGKSPSYSWR
jgi:hypothetical protein